MWSVSAHVVWIMTSALTPGVDEPCCLTSAHAMIRSQYATVKAHDSAQNQRHTDSGHLGDQHSYTVGARTLEGVPPPPTMNVVWHVTLPFFLCAINVYFSYADNIKQIQMTC